MNIEQTLTERAETYAQAKAELNDDQKVGERYSVSARTVRNYLKFLTLPESVRLKADKGEISLNKALRGFSEKNAIKKIGVGLSDLGYIALDHLYVQRYLTIEQMARYLGEDYNKAANILADLKVAGYVDVETSFRPYAYWLSHKGSSRLGHEPLKRWKSANALHQELMRNEIELSIREDRPTATFYSRIRCMKKGLNPSNGEYLLSYKKDGLEKLAFVLIDDYQMPPNRVKHSLNRPHNPPKDYYKGMTMRFSDLVGDVLVYVTSQNRMNFHKLYYEKAFGDFSKYSVRYKLIESVWGGF